MTTAELIDQHVDIDPDPSHDCGLEDWEHHYDPESTLGDYYTCAVCGALMQVG